MASASPDTTFYYTGAHAIAAGHYPEAMRALKQAESLYRQSDEPVWLGRTCYKIAECYYRVGLGERAEQYFKESIRLLQTLDSSGRDMRFVSCAYRDLGTIVPAEEQSRRYYGEAYRYADMLSDTVLYADIARMEAWRSEADSMTIRHWHTDIEVMDVVRYYEEEAHAQTLLEMQRQRRLIVAVAVLSVLLLLAVAAVLLGLWLGVRRRRRRDLRVQRDTVLMLLRGRLELTRAYRQAQAAGKTVRVERWLFDTEEIDRVLGGFFSSLRERYPQLTESDVQFLCFTLVDATDEDLAIILDQQKSSIYQRRNRVKLHLGIEVTNLKEWLFTQLNAYCL